MAVELSNSFDVSKKSNIVDSPKSTVIEQQANTAPDGPAAADVPGEVAGQPEPKLRLRPLVDRVLVRVLPEKDEPVNGLYMPDEAKEKPQEGVVVAVGKGRIVNGELIPVDVQVGSLVVFGKYSGNEIKFLGEKLLLLQESELMGEYYAE